MQGVRKHDGDPQVDLIAAALALVARIPDRQCGMSSRLLYGRVFNRMWAEAELDPLRPGDARDTYQVRRAALHYCSRRLLLSVLKKLDELAEGCRVDSDPSHQASYNACLKTLENFLRRLEPALDRDPPMCGNTADFSSASRWKTESDCTKIRGAGSKKHALPKLPRSWIAQLWSYVPMDHKYRDAVAVLSVSPARVGEVVPGDRPSGFSKGVHVKLDNEGRLVLTHSPQKTHNGKYGMESAGVKVDPAAEGQCALHLAQRCRDEGGEFVVRVQSSGALSKAIKRIGEKVFPEGPKITANVLRHQRIADAKVAFGAGEKVALAAGQSTDGTQAKYGNVVHGRRGGLIDAFGSRKPRLGAVARAHELGIARRNSRPLNRPT